MRQLKKTVRKSWEQPLLKGCVLVFLCLVGCQPKMVTVDRSDVMKDEPVQNDMNTTNDVRTVLTEKPFFEVKWTVSNLSYYVCINDMIVKCNITDAVEGTMTTSLPVNHYMKSGENRLSIWALPEGSDRPIESGQSIAAELWVRSANPEIEGSYKIASVHCDGEESLCFDEEQLPKPERLSSTNEFLPAEDGDILIKHQVPEVLDAYVEETAKGYEVGVMVEVPNVLPRWGFFDSEGFDFVDDMTDAEFEQFERSLLAEYMKVQDALADGSEEAIDAIMPMFEERSREVEQALYLKPGSMQRLLREDLIAAGNKEKFELVNLRYESCNIRFEQNDRIISLQRLGEDAAIGVNYKAFTGCQNFDIYFRRQNGKWIICR